MRALKAWAFALVPAAGLLELGAHLVQARESASEQDWNAARDYVAAQAKDDDLVTFAPRWIDPVGRMRFGDKIATVAREARADETRFARAFEVSVRGAHAAELSSWRRADNKSFGNVTVTTLENPAPAHVIDDLVSMVNPMQMRVSRGDGSGVMATANSAECAFVHGSAQSGGLGWGPAVPADRFNCPGGGFVGESVVADLDYRPRRCVYAPPQAPNQPLRLRFLGVHFGRSLHGHHALYVEAERDRKGAPVTLAFRVGDATIGSVIHRDGEGWKAFELDTSDLAGQREDLVAEIASTGGERRMYCFEADTR